MPNKPRPNNRHRMVRVEDELWEAAKDACAKLGTTRAEIMRTALRKAVKDAANVQWRVRHVETGVTAPCFDQREAEAHVRESCSGPWVAERVPGASEDA